jgi:hypothetical protein
MAGESEGRISEDQNYFLQKVKTISYRRPKLLKNLAKDQNSHFVEIMTLWGLFNLLQNASFDLLKFDPVIISLSNAADPWAHLTEQTKLETH